MCKGTELAILALGVSIQVRGTELGLVLVRVIKFFHSIVSLVASILIGTFLVIFNVPALFGLIEAQWSSSVFFVVVVEWTLLKVVILRIVQTRLCLE